MKITAKEVLARLASEGYQETRVRGDHHRFENGDGRKVSVPYSRIKDTISPGTYRFIKQQAGWQ